MGSINTLTVLELTTLVTRERVAITKDTISMNSMNGVLAVVLMVAVTSVHSYDEIYDKLDVDKILADEELFDAYMKCLLDKGPCSVEHSPEFRKLIPEVIAEACAKCTKIQRSHVRKTVKALQEKRPDEFEEFRKKYDPDNKYQEAFAAFVVATD